MLLGAGRAAKDDVIDPAAGLVLAVRTGDRVEVGGLLGTLHANRAELFDAAEERFRAAVRLGDSHVSPPPLFHEM